VTKEKLQLINGMKLKQTLKHRDSTITDTPQPKQYECITFGKGYNDISNGYAEILAVDKG
jgi:hypothetical protein